MKDLVTCYCEYCGSSFEATRWDAKYCPGGKCKAAAYRAKKKYAPGASDSASSWLDKVDTNTRERFYGVRTLSDVAASLLTALAATYGPDAAKLATHAADHVVFGTMKPKREQWEIELEKRSEHGTT